MVPAVSVEEKGMREEQEFVGGPEALALLEPRLRGLPEASVSPFRASVPQAVANALQVVRSFGEDRALFVAAFKQKVFDPVEFDDLEQRALALWQADVNYRLTMNPEEAIVGILDEARSLRKKLLSAASYLWTEDAIIGPRLAAVRKGHGHMDLADDLVTLASVFDGNWSYARTRCDVKRSDLGRAREISHQVLHALTLGKDRTAVEAARDLRDRAAAYANQGIRVVRAAAGFLFCNDMARLDEYPSMFAGRSTSRRPAPEAPPLEPIPEIRAGAAMAAP
jgi:hypothetical protein